MFNAWRMRNFVIEVYERAFYAHPFTIEMLNFDLKCFPYVVSLVKRHSPVENDVHFCKYTGSDLRIRNKNRVRKWDKLKISLWIN